MKRLPPLLYLVLSLATARSATLQDGEWFINEDPGAGSGTPFSALETSTITLTSSVIHALPPGVHLLGVRLRDNNGEWGHVVWRGFLRADVPTQSATLARGEWFIDTDPGFGSGTVFTSSGENQLVTLTTEDLKSVAPGVHLLGFRLEDSRGRWGQTIWRAFLKDESSGIAPQVAGIEYRIVRDGAVLAIATVPASPAQLDVNLSIAHGNGNLLLGSPHGLQAIPVDTSGRRGIPVTAGFTYQSYSAVWTQAHFDESERADPEISGPNADPDGDGLSNATERLFALSPRDPSDATKAGTSFSTDETKITLGFRVPAGGILGADGIYRTSNLTYRILEGPSPSANQSVPPVWIQSWTVDPLDQGAGLLEVRLAPPPSEKRFFRMIAEE